MNDNVFKFFTDHSLISLNNSGFKPEDSYINQLISITHNKYISFNERNEVRGFFLDISKAFEKVWLEGLLFKLKQNGQNGITGELVNFTKDF